MQAIWKFPFDVADQIEIEMPVGSRLLDVQAQHGQPCLWALVDRDEGTAPEVRRFRLYGTGHAIEKPDDVTLRYVGTFQLLAGQFVGHLFEERHYSPLPEHVTLDEAVRVAV